MEVNWAALVLVGLWILSLGWAIAKDGQEHTEKISAGFNAFRTVLWCSLLWLALRG